jgi:hypothetical protein
MDALAQWQQKVESSRVFAALRVCGAGPLGHDLAELRLRVTSRSHALGQAGGHKCQPAMHGTTLRRRAQDI